MEPPPPQSARDREMPPCRNPGGTADRYRTVGCPELNRELPGRSNSIPIYRSLHLTQKMKCKVSMLYWFSPSFPRVFLEFPQGFPRFPECFLLFPRRGKPTNSTNSQQIHTDIIGQWGARLVSGWDRFVLLPAISFAG